MSNADLEKKVKASFSKYYTSACETVLSEHPADPRRVFFLRPSSFPFCGVRKFLSWPETLEADGLTHMDAGMLFYVTVGHAFHDVFQELLGKHGQLVGDWRCYKCKAIKKFSTYARCSNCDKPTQYRELEVTYKKTLVGHVDGLYLDKATDTYWVIDYKSTSSRSLFFHKKKPKFPYKNNVHQIVSYVPLLEQKYGIKVSGYMLVYLPRDNPFQAKLICIKATGPRAKAEVVERLDRWVKAHRRALRVNSLDGFRKLEKLKLCTSEKDYLDNYHSDYNPCDHRKVCFNAKALEAKAEKVLKLCRSKLPMITQAPREIQMELGIPVDQK